MCVCVCVRVCVCVCVCVCVSVSVSVSVSFEGPDYCDASLCKLAANEIVLLCFQMFGKVSGLVVALFLFYPCE